MAGQIVAALIPAALLILLGAVLRRRRVMPAEFWAPAEWLSYYVLLPALFVHGLATADPGAVPVARIFAVLVGALLVTGGLVAAARPRLGVTDAAFTSVFQGAVRFNNYVGVMLATGLYGVQGTALAAVCNAAIVPTVNIMAVLVFARHGDARPSARGVVRLVATNPLVLSCALGMTLQLTGLGLPPGIDGTLRALGQAALALGLLCVGAALDLRPTRADLQALLAASSVKFLLLPALTLAACLTAGLSGPAGVVAVMFHSLPTASSSYILARQLGGDARLMAAIIAMQTLIAAATVPVAVTLAAALLA